MLFVNPSLAHIPGVYTLGIAKENNYVIYIDLPSTCNDFRAKKATIRRVFYRLVVPAVLFVNE
jgi:hypothetical protein